jgi:hypothetical protein
MWQLSKMVVVLMVLTMTVKIRFDSLVVFVHAFFSAFFV